jgi:hypothetical protein
LVPVHRWRDGSLLADQELETAAVFLAKPMGTAEQPVLVVREALLVPEEAYLLRKADSISIDPVWMNRLTRPTRDRNWSVIALHTHPGAREPWFSQADDDLRWFRLVESANPVETGGRVAKVAMATFTSWPAASCGQVPPVHALHHGLGPRPGALKVVGLLGLGCVSMVPW